LRTKGSTSGGVFVFKGLLIKVFVRWVKRLGGHDTEAGATRRREAKFCPVSDRVPHRRVCNSDQWILNDVAVGRDQNQTAVLWIFLGDFLDSFLGATPTRVRLAVYRQSTNIDVRHNSGIPEGFPSSLPFISGVIIQICRWCERQAKDSWDANRWLVGRHPVRVYSSHNFIDCCRYWLASTDHDLNLFYTVKV
jgi:hypothetical protein